MTWHEALELATNSVRLPDVDWMTKRDTRVYYEQIRDVMTGAGVSNSELADAMRALAGAAWETRHEGPETPAQRALAVHLIAYAFRHTAELQPDETWVFTPFTIH